MALEIEATYENGVLRPDHQLPLSEHQRVKLTVQEEPRRSQRSYGLLGWTGDPEVIRRIAEDDQFGVSESP
jgi:predicted DNA-binding antitoxin AbrB/MazE fold protein